MLELQGVRKTFHPGTANEIRSLQGVDLSVEDGSMVMVIGTNGSGKSTLLNAIAGTFEIDNGSIRIDSQVVTGWPEYRRARYIGRVFQNPFSGTARPTSPSLRISPSPPNAACRVALDGRCPASCARKCARPSPASIWAWRTASTI